MKLLRILLIAFCALALVLVVIVALASSSGVQTWAAKKFAPSSPELTVSIGRVDAGLDQTRLENVRIVQPGLVLTLPLAELDVSVLDAVGGKVDVKRLVAKGWILDLTAPGLVGDTPAGRPTTSPDGRESSSAEEPFNGIFKLLDLPVDLTVDGVDLAGDVVLPEGQLQVAINGGGLAAGKDGKFTLTSELTAGASKLTVKGVATARLATPRTFERLGLTATATAKSPELPNGASVDFMINAASESGAEAYVLSLRNTARELVQAEARLPAGTAPLTGSWKIDATHTDAAPFALGQPLPEFAAKGQGTFEADRAFAQIKARGDLDATLDNLASVQPELAALGKLTLAAGFDVATDGDVVNLNKLDVRLNGTRPVLTISALQPVKFNTASNELTANNPSAELLRISLDGLPLAWAKPFLGDLSVTGGDVRGAFTANASDGGFIVRPATPITLTNVSISQAGEPLLRSVDILVAAQAYYTPKGWTATVTEFSVRSAGAVLLKATVKASQETARTDQPLKADGTFEASLPALLNQPVAAGSVALQQGVARGDFTASVAKLQAFTFTLQLADLATAAAPGAQSAAPLPSVALQARADIAADGRIDAKIPVVITNAGRRSDLNLSATIRPSDNSTRIDAQLASDTLYLEDVMLFSGLSPESPSVPAPSTPPAGKPGTTPDKTPSPSDQPVWAGVEGELKLALKRVIYSPEVETSDVSGSMKITPAALTLEGIRATIGKDGKFGASGGLTFDAKQAASPYGLNADVTLTNVDPEPFLRSSGKPAPVTGNFDIATTLNGRAETPAGFGESVLGDVKLTGRDGTFRALDAKLSSAVSNASRGAAIVGILGSAFGSASTARYADQARAAADVVQQLSSIQFDRLNLVLARDADKNMEVKDLSLFSQYVSLAGSGVITHVPDVPLRQQPLLVNLQLGAKGKLADDLRTLKLLKAEGDESGFTQLIEVLKLEGSLQSLSTRQLQSLIERALLN